MAPSVVLVTGVSRFLGGHLAARLAADPSIERVLGVDTAPPPRDMLRRMGRAEFVRADIRNPLIAKVISTRDGRHRRPRVAVGQPRSVRGALDDEGDERHRHDAAARGLPEGADTVRRLVLKSTTAVYGASPRDPATVRRDHDAEGPPAGGLREGRRRDRGLPARLRPPPAGRLGHDAALRQPHRPAHRHRRSPATSRCRWSPPCSATTPACSCCTRRTRSPCSSAPRAQDLPGVFNVGGRRRAAALAGHPARRAGSRCRCPQPAVRLGRPAAPGARGWSTSRPEQMRLLNFGRVVDTTQAAHGVRVHPALDHRAGVRRLRARPRRCAR